MTSEYDIERRQLTIEHQRKNSLLRQQGEILKRNTLLGYADSGINNSSKVVEDDVNRINQSLSDGLDYEDSIYMSSILKSRLHEDSMFFSNAVSLVGQVSSIFSPQSWVGKGIINMLSSGGKKK